MEVPVGKPPSFTNRPKALVCHICGREFGTKSLVIHQKSCAHKWEQAEAQKPKHLRRPLPSIPTNDLPVSMSRDDLETRNKKAMDTFEKQAMKQCPNCFRTFLEERLEVHLRSCTAERPHKPVPRGKETLQPSPVEEVQVIPEKEVHTAAPEEPSAETLRAAFQQFGHRTSLEDFQEAEKEAALACEQASEPIPEQDEVGSDLEAPPEFADESLTEAVDSQEAYYAMGVFSPKRKPKIAVPVELEEEKREEMDQFDLQLPRVACGSCGELVSEDQVTSHEATCKLERKPVLQAEKPAIDPAAPVDIPKVEVVETKRPKTASSPVLNTKASIKKLNTSIDEANPKAIEAKPVPELRKTAPIAPTKPRITPSPVPISSPTADISVPASSALVPCPHCGRKFAPEAASRHISICQDVRNRPKAPPALLSASVRASLPSLPSEVSPRSPVSRSPVDATVLLKGTEECPNCRGLISGILLPSHLKVCRPRPVKSERKGDSKAFCAGCGEKYLPEAKFCISCGSKRLPS